MRIIISVEKDSKKDSEKKKRTPYSFSKKIPFAGFCCLIVVLLFTFYIVLKTENVEPLVVLIGLFGVCLTAAIGFYYWKERSNNNFKYAEDFIERMADKYGIENIVEILQTLISSNTHTE